MAGRHPPPHVWRRNFGKRWLLKNGKINGVRLDSKRVARIRRNAAAGVEREHLAEVYQVTAMTIFNILTFKTWRYI